MAASGKTIDRLAVEADEVNGRSVDLSRMVLDIMIPEVRELLVAARNAHIQSLQSQLSDLSTSLERSRVMSPQNMIVGYDRFSALVKSSMQKRQLGKSYVYAPKKKPEVTHQMKLEEEACLTFRPDLSLMPSDILNGRALGLSYLTEHLYGQAQVIKAKHEAKREQAIANEEKGCTFKPFLYKPPKGVNPSYRGSGGMLVTSEHQIDEKVGNSAFPQRPLIELRGTRSSSPSLVLGGKNDQQNNSDFNAT